MKVNPDAGLLVEKLQEVYALERGHVLETRAAADPTIPPPPVAVEANIHVDPTSARMEVIALRAMAGEYEDERALQASVIDVVMEEKLKTAHSGVRDQVLDLLCDDPEFSRRIETMLVIAVRDIARRSI